MRRKIIAGNWKMNLLSEEARDLVKGIYSGIHNVRDEVEFIISPAALYLSEIADYLKETERIQVAAQHVSLHDSGAHTGEISMPMLRSVGVNTLLIGHSERRTIYGETDHAVQEKVLKGLRKGFTVILALGEALDVRENGGEAQFVQKQLELALDRVEEVDLSKLIIAYEPIWAIGTGNTATPQQAEAMHREIRAWMGAHFSKGGEQVPILYGGSVKAGNAADLFEQENIDGALIGGASLEAQSFLDIAEAMQKELGK